MNDYLETAADTLAVCTGIALEALARAYVFVSKSQLQVELHPLHWYLIPKATVIVNAGRLFKWLCLTVVATYPPSNPPRDTAVYPAPQCTTHIPRK